MSGLTTYLNQIQNTHKKSQFDLYILYKTSFKTILHKKIVQKIIQNHLPISIIINMAGYKIGKLPNQNQLLQTCLSNLPLLNTLTLDLSSNQLEHSHQIPIIPQLSSLTLILQNNFKTNTQIFQSYIASLPQIQNLKTLKINLNSTNIGLNNKQLSILGQNLIKITKLDSLSLQLPRPFLLPEQFNLDQLNIIQLNLKTLHLDYSNSNHEYNGQDSISIKFPQIQLIPSLKSVSLNLSNNKISRLIFPKVYSNHNTCTHLIYLELNLKSNQLGKNASYFNDLCQYIGSLKYLEFISLYLDNNELHTDKQNLKILCSAFQDLLCLQKLRLSLSDNRMLGISSENMKILGENLVSLSHIKDFYLDLSYTWQGKEQENLEYLFMGLENLKKLECLELSLQNNMLDKYQSYYFNLIKQTVEKLPKLTQLTVNINKNSDLKIMNYPELHTISTGIKSRPQILQYFNLQQQ